MIEKKDNIKLRNGITGGICDFCGKSIFLPGTPQCNERHEVDNQINLLVERQLEREINAGVISKQYGQGEIKKESINIEGKTGVMETDDGISPAERQRVEASIKQQIEEIKKTKKDEQASKSRAKKSSKSKKSTK